MPTLEDIAYYDDKEDVGAEADFTNLETNITVSPIPTTRVHKDHLVTQIIGDLSTATQTRSMTRMVKDQGGLTQINNKDFHTCMFACFLSQEEPKMEEGINYEKVFALVARIEAIRLFLAYASFMGFMVYQMDVKSAFLYGTIEEDVYVCQPLGFKDPDYPDKVYKVVKALYGHQAPRAWYETLANYLLENSFQRGKIDQTMFIRKQKGDILLVQVYVDDIIFGSINKDLSKDFEKLMKDKFQMSPIGELTSFLGLQVKQKPDGIFISQDKYVAEILRKFGLTDGKSAITPIDTEKPLLKDPDGEDVDVHTYKSMIGSLMYLTSSRPDIIDYAGASLDKKSTTGGCQFLRCRLISWQYKKHTVVVTSSTEAEYVTDVAQSSMKSLKRNLHVTNILNQTVSGKDSSNPLMADILPKIVWYSTHHVALMKSWLVQKQTALGKTKTGKENSNPFMAVKKVNDVTRLQALIVRKKVIIIEATVREALRLDDAESINCLPNEERFTELSRIGVGKGFSGVETPLFKSMIVAQQADDVADEVAAGFKKLERKNELKVSGLKRSRKVGTTQRVESSTDTVMDDQEDASKQGEIIANIDADEDVTLKDVADVEKTAKIDKDANVQGRLEESQAQIYKIDLEYADKVLSMQDDELELAKLKEVVEVVTTAKLMTKVVTAAASTITSATTLITAAPSAARRRKGVVIRDPEVTATPFIIIHSEPKSKDKRKKDYG
nr:putative ribonuclease H-like domain-containing protein [Tanacetum cinerariifolium]